MHSNIDEIPVSFFFEKLFNTYCLRTKLNFVNMNIVVVLLDQDRYDARKKNEDKENSIYLLQNSLEKVKGNCSSHKKCYNLRDYHIEFID
jgi:hypothetical protein